MRRVIIGTLAAAAAATALPALAAPAAGAMKIDAASAQAAMVDHVQWRDDRGWGREDRGWGRDDRGWGHDRWEHQRWDRGYHYGWRRPAYRGYYYNSCRWGYWRDRWGRLHCRSAWY